MAALLVVRWVQMVFVALLWQVLLVEMTAGLLLMIGMTPVILVVTLAVITVVMEVLTILALTPLLVRSKWTLLVWHRLFIQILEPAQPRAV